LAAENLAQVNQFKQFLCANSDSLKELFNRVSGVPSCVQLKDLTGAFASERDLHRPTMENNKASTGWVLLHFFFFWQCTHVLLRIIFNTSGIPCEMAEAVWEVLKDWYQVQPTMY
jgi:hypothetical protein